MENRQREIAVAERSQSSRSPGTHPSRGCELVLLLLGIGVGTAYYWAYFADLLPLWEFREWVTWSLHDGEARTALSNLVTRENPGFARHATMLYVRSLGDHCGLDVRCLNAWMLLPASLSAGLLYAVARQLGFARGLALAAVVLWWFSAPVADAFAWQATINDRMALVFVLAALCLCIQIIDLPLGAFPMWVGNVGVAIPLILAYNSKESAWFLAPSLVLAALTLRSGHGRRRLEGLLFFAVPLGYAAYNNYRYFFVSMPSQRYWTSHVFGEEPSETLPYLTMGLIGLRPWWFESAIGLLALGLLLLICHPLSRTRLRQAAAERPLRIRSLVWCGGTFAAAMAIPLRTKFHALYYLYLPEAFFVLLMLGTLGLLIDASSGEKRTRVLARFAVAVVVAAWLLQFQLSASVVPRLVATTYSENFNRTLEFLVARLGPEKLSSVNFVGHPSNARSHMFVESASRRSLFRFHLSPTQLEAMPEGPVRRLDRAQCESVHPQAARVPPVCVALDPSMGIESVREGRLHYRISN